jgi:hypothetical protein
MHLFFIRRRPRIAASRERVGMIMQTKKSRAFLSLPEAFSQTGGEGGIRTLGSG